MTVNVEIPITRHTAADGVSGYAFNWSSQDINENRVQVGGVEKTRLVDYDILDYTEESGGLVSLYVTPEEGTEVTIYRRTPISQQVNYEQYTKFPAEIHEGQMDKDTRILQEQANGFGSNDGTVDLSTTQFPDEVLIENTAGTDARIQGWKPDGSEAGVFFGQVSSSIPADGSATSLPDGYVWLEVANINTVAQIVMTETPINLVWNDNDPVVAGAEWQFQGLYGRNQTTTKAVPGDSSAIEFLPAISPAPTAVEQFWVRMQNVGNDANWHGTSDARDVWFDAYTGLGATFTRIWKTIQQGPGTKTAEGIFQIAPDNGAGAPDESLAVSKAVTVTSTVT